MPYFGRDSSDRLETCHPDLQRLFREVVQQVDCAILCGHRDQAEQMRVYREGLSQLWYPRSKHNLIPSMAVDVAPFHAKKPHVRWQDKDSWYFFGGYVKGVADQMGIRIRWGGDFDMDGNFRDQSLIDLPHYELF